MTRRIEISITILFIIVIFSVGIVQGIVEIRRGESVQFFDALEDTFITPVKKKAKAAALYNDLVQKMAAIKTRLEQLRKSGEDDANGWSSAEAQAEESIYTVADIKKTLQNVNRHRTRNGTAQSIVLLDSLQSLLDDFFDNIQAQSAPDELLAEQKKIDEYISHAKKKYRQPGPLGYPLLVIKHFIFYTIFNREYLRKYETELEETSVFANTLRPFMQFFRYVAFHDWGEKALEGRDGWLFYKQGVNYLIRPYILDPRSVVVDPEDTPISDNAIDTIVAFNRELARHGIEMMVVVVPGKASIYPDMLSSRVSPDKAGTFGHSIRFMQELESRGIETVNLHTALAKARKEDTVSGDALYLAQDTHWKTRGVRVVAQAIAQKVRKKSWFTALEDRVEYVLDTVTIERDGDIRVMADLPAFNVPFLKIPFIKEPVLCNQVYQITRDEDSSIVKRHLFRDDYRRARILILGDSFSRIYQSDAPRSAGWIAHLAYELSVPVCSIVSDGGASTLVREKLERKKNVLKGKKLVIWEFVERDIRYGAEGWRDIKL